MVGPEFLRPGDSRDIFVVSFELEKDQYLKIKPLYEALYADLVQDNWEDPLGGDKFESLYWEKINMNAMKEHNIWWRCVKYPLGKDMKNMSYVRYALKVDFQTLAVNPTEIAYKNKKANVERADFILRMWFWVQWDWGDRFKNSTVKQFENLFRKKLYKQEIEQHKTNLYNFAQKLRQFVKDYLDMAEEGQRPRLFHPEGGYKDQF